MRIQIGNRVIDVSDQAELSELTIRYELNEPQRKPGPVSSWTRRWTHAVSLVMVDIAGDHCRIGVDGTQQGDLLPGVYDVTEDCRREREAAGLKTQAR